MRRKELRILRAASDDGTGLNFGAIIPFFLLFSVGASILFLKALHRKLENNNILMLIIFLIDEQKNSSVDEYLCFLKENLSDF